MSPQAHLNAKGCDPDDGPALKVRNIHLDTLSRTSTSDAIENKNAQAISCSSSPSKFHSFNHFLYEKSRLETFQGWNTPFIKPEELAKEGFIYLKMKDVVSCIFCNGVIGFWEEEDRPSTEHSKHFPRCPFVQNREQTSNVPIGPNKEEHKKLFDFLNAYLDRFLAVARPAKPKYDEDIVDVPQIHYPGFRYLDERVKSFQKCSTTLRSLASKLAEAGFLYAGISDFTICFSCGGGMFNWTEAHDPVQEHAKAYSFCQFINLKRNLSTKPASHNSGECELSDSYNFSLTLNEDQESLLLHHPFSKNLLAAGIRRKTVTEAMKAFLECEGTLPKSIHKWFELAYDWEDQNQLSHSCSKQTSNVIIDCMKRDQHQKNREVSYKDLLIEEVRSLEKAVKIEEEKDVCLLCKMRTREVIYLPCNHLHHCKFCSMGRNYCPTCGHNIRGTLFPIFCL